MASSYGLGFGLGIRADGTRGRGASVSASRGSPRCAIRSRWRMDYSVVSKERLEELFGGEGAQEVTAKYRFQLEVSGDKSKEVYGSIFQEFKKKARFPGFKIGQVPPFMMTEIRAFTLEEVLSSSVSSALEQSNLKPMEGEAFVPEYSPKFPDLKKSFKPGQDLAFTVELACVEGDKPEEEPAAEKQGGETEDTEQADANADAEEAEKPEA